MQHVTVYRQPGRFAGWPANYGMWAFGEEIVLGFTVGYCGGAESQFHTRDMARPFETVQARSTDGGCTWRVEPHPAPAPGNRALSADEHVRDELGIEHALKQLDCINRPRPHPGGIDFTAPDFAFMGARTGIRKGCASFFYTSTDRCRSWDGPFSLPMFGQTGVAARSDCVALGPRECLLMLTASKPDGAEGRVLCVRTADGGATFERLSYIGPEVPDGWVIMPASVRLPSGRILTALRCGAPAGGDRPWRHWIDLHVSDDAGATWRHLARPEQDVGRNGNPPTLTRLPDGRLVITFGRRDEPCGIRARLSADDGAKWSDPITLRDDGGAADLGYPRTVALPDGSVVTAYYFTDLPYGERYIAATRWRP